MRALRRAGYDGVVLGRVLAGPDGDALLAQIAADSEVASDTAHTGLHPMPDPHPNPSRRRQRSAPGAPSR